jgi:hypothetical protein
MEEIVLFGAGGLGRHIARQLIARGHPPVAMRDSDPKKHGTSFGGIPVVSPAEAVKLNKMIVVAISNDSACMDVFRELGKYDVRYMTYKCFAQKYDVTLDSFMTDQELFYLAELASSLATGSSWIEIGTWKGQSFEATAKRIPRACSLWAVDLWQDSMRIRHEWQSRLETLQCSRRDVAMGMLQMASLEAAKLFSDRTLGGVFIDASHKYEDVLADIKAWYPKLRPGGVLCGHDLGSEWPGVGEALATFTNITGLHYHQVIDSLWRIET